MNTIEERLIELAGLISTGKGIEWRATASSGWKAQYITGVIEEYVIEGFGEIRIRSEPHYRSWTGMEYIGKRVREKEGGIVRLISEWCPHSHLLGERYVIGCLCVRPDDLMERFDDMTDPANPKPCGVEVTK